MQPQGGQGGTFNGQMNKGVAAPATKMGSVMPGLNNGGGR